MPYCVSDWAQWQNQIETIKECDKKEKNINQEWKIDQRALAQPARERNVVIMQRPGNQILKKTKSDSAMDWTNNPTLVQAP